MSESCPVCGSAIARVALALCERIEDKSQTCQRVVKCAGDGHITWRWNDTPDDPPVHEQALAFVFP